MKNSKSYYRINFEKENIEISKSFATAAKTPKTAAHEQLMALREAYPGFSIVLYKTKITQNKQKYKGLTREEMRRRIIEWSGEKSPNLATLDKAIAEMTPMPTIKKWYLGIYGEHYKRANMAMPVVEEVGGEVATASNC